MYMHAMKYISATFYKYLFYKSASNPYIDFINITHTHTHTVSQLHTHQKKLPYMCVCVCVTVCTHIDYKQKKEKNPYMFVWVWLCVCVDLPRWELIRILELKGDNGGGDKGNDLVITWLDLSNGSQYTKDYFINGSE